MFIALANAFKVLEVPNIGNPTGYISVGLPPQQRYKASIASSSSQIFIYGGYPLKHNEIWYYDLSTSMWGHFITGYPSPRSENAMFFSQNSQKLYFFGGIGKTGLLNDFFTWDLYTEKWEWLRTFGDIPDARKGLGYCKYEYQGVEYFAIFGGDLYKGKSYELFIFNTETNYWKFIASIGDGTSFQLACSNDIIFIYSESAFYSFTIANNSFESLTPGPSLFNTCAVVSASNFYLIFGLTLSKPSSFIYKYDPTTFAWEYTKTTIFPRHSVSCTSSGDNIYIFGGVGSTGPFNDFYRFNTDISLLLNINIEYPSPRMYGTFTILLGEGYLIGGESASEIYADVWKLNLNDFNWEPVLISGEYFGITRHAACTFSGSLIVFGGITNTGLSNKLYQYSLDGYLTEISNTAQATPSPRLGACMVSLNTSLYIFGGETVTGIFSPELWRFDFSNLTYTLIAEHFEGLAYHNCMVEENFLYAMFGKTNSGWYNLNVIRYNTSGYLEEWEIFSEFTEYTAWATVLLIQNEVIRIGGEIDGLASNEIAIIDLKTGDITEKQSMDWAVFGSASGTFNKTVYMIGGVQSIGNVPVLNPSYRNIQINIPELLCDPGTRSDGNTCRGCRAGTFSLKSNSLDCANCAEGTYNSNSNSDSNKYCLPCPNDKFGPNKGLDACFDCPSFSYCPVGAIQPQLKYTASLENSTNPNLSTSISSYNSISFALEILCIAVGVTLILLFLSNRTIRKWFKSTDIFKQNHNEKLGQPMILRKTEIGGCFTMLFITASIYLSLITLIYFFLENISISQALVPLVSIEQGYNRISGDISFNIFLKNFGADCPGDDTCSKLLTTTDISYSEFLAVCTSIEKTCSLYYKFKDCELGSFPKLELKISKEMCFVSSIEVNITAATGIQDTVSSTLVTISPDEDKVLIGNTPSILSLAVIYSVYNTGTSVTTGYYIISNTQPTLGSAYAPSNVPFYSTLFLDINLNKEDSALLTLTDLQQATQLIVTGLLGGVTGLLQIFSYLMDTTESVYNYAVGKIKNKRKINNISWHSKQLESNFDKESVLITRQSIRMADCSFSSNDITVEDIE